MLVWRCAKAAHGSKAIRYGQTKYVAIQAMQLIRRRHLLIHSCQTETTTHLFQGKAWELLQQLPRALYLFKKQQPEKFVPTSLPQTPKIQFLKKDKDKKKKRQRVKLLFFSPTHISGFPFHLRGIVLNIWKINLLFFPRLRWEDQFHSTVTELKSGCVSPSLAWGLKTASLSIFN